MHPSVAGAPEVVIFDRCIVRVPEPPLSRQPLFAAAPSDGTRTHQEPQLATIAPGPRGRRSVHPARHNRRCLANPPRVAALEAREGHGTPEWHEQLASPPVAAARRAQAERLSSRSAL